MWSGNTGEGFKIPHKAWDAVKRATPYDCFPYTEHIETVVLLCR